MKKVKVLVYIAILILIYFVSEKAGEFISYLTAESLSRAIAIILVTILVFMKGGEKNESIRKQKKSSKKV